MSRLGQGRGKDKGKAPNHAYAVQVDYDIPVGTTINDMILVYSFWVRALFDTGASHSFIFVLFAKIFGFNLVWFLFIFEPLKMANPLNVFL